MYDEIIKKVELTADETDIILGLLRPSLDGALSLGEVQTIEELIEKLS